MNTEALVKRALSRVNDPDLHRDLVSLGMVTAVEQRGDKVHILLTLTTPACPLKERIKQDCLRELHSEMPEYEGKFEIEFSSEVTSRRANSINVLPSVKNIICVTSGKGGVGKSTVSVNLAIELSKTGASVGLIDADIYGPSVPTMLGIRGKRPDVRKIKEKFYILPFETHGIKVLSIGLLADDRQAIVWRGPMVTSALKQFVTDCLWGKLDYLVVDMPPGTGDVHLTVAQTMQVTGAIIVTTPQEVALADARKAVAMFRLENLQVPIIGVVENMAWFETEELPGRRFPIFGEGGGRRLAEEYEVPYLGEVPLAMPIREGGDTGSPVAESNDVKTAYFRQIAETAARQIAIANAQKQATSVN